MRNIAIRIRNYSCCIHKLQNVQISNSKIINTFTRVPRTLYISRKRHYKSWFTNVTRHSGWWPSTVTPSIDQALHQFLTLLLILTLLPNLTIYLIARGFHRTFATGAACQQRTLTPPDTWSCPTLGLASVLMLRPISPELVLFLDFWVSNIPRYFCFCLQSCNVRIVIIWIKHIAYTSYLFPIFRW